DDFVAVDEDENQANEQANSATVVPFLNSYLLAVSTYNYDAITSAYSISAEKSNFANVLSVISKMSLRRRFSASNNYLGLEEAINSIEDSDDGFEYDLAIIPSEPSVVTDEENLPTNLPNDVPGNIEVFIRDEGALFDSSDDEPLASKRARIRPSLPQATGDHSTNSTASISTDPGWCKCNPIYTKTYMESDTNRVSDFIKFWCKLDYTYARQDWLI
ncbi:hypothetical protein HHI36_007125, partial [Cryptolaemus montrouzieri]